MTHAQIRKEYLSQQKTFYDFPELFTQENVNLYNLVYKEFKEQNGKYLFCYKHSQFAHFAYIFVKKGYSSNGRFHIRYVTRTEGYTVPISLSALREVLIIPDEKENN